MLNNLKALVVILALAWAGFALFKPYCLEVMSAQTFSRRRNAWILLTIVAFASPSFWIYSAVAIVVLVREVKRDDNPLALFVWLTFVIPNSSFYIPTVVINSLFDLTQYRLLSLLVLAPFIARWFRQRRPSAGGALTWVDFSLILFLILKVALVVTYQSLTVTMRQSFLLVIDFLFVLYAFSRQTDRTKIAEVVAAFCMANILMALIGIVEWGKGWLLYTGISEVWGDPNIFAWLIRGDRLRAQAAAQGPLNLGYHLAMTLGLFMYLRTLVTGRSMRNNLVLALIVVGLYTTSSRAPWLTGFMAVVVFLAFRPGAAKQLFRVAVGGAVIIAVMYVTPLRESVLDRLPIIGTTDQDTIEYRQQLAELSWQLIRQHPFFGDPFVTAKMESMRQGQGIIDIVNGYLFTLLFTGWVGMTLQGFGYVAAFVQGAWALWRCRPVSNDLGALGASLVACFAATLFYIATAGPGTTTYVLAGLLISFATVVKTEMAASKQAYTAQRYAGGAAGARSPVGLGRPA